MRNPFRLGGFEGRLLGLFLVLSVIPTVLIAIFGIEYFTGYVDRLSNVALRESFHNSMEIALPIPRPAPVTKATGLSFGMEPPI